MNTYAVYDTTGRILYVHSSNEAPSGLASGLAALQVPDETVVGFQTHMVSNGALIPFVPSLSDIALAKLQSAAAQYAGLFAAPSGFTYGGKLYQVDPASQSNIAAMGSLATASLANPSAVPWPVGFYWIDAANDHNGMTAAQMLAFAAAVASYVSSCVLNYAAIKSAIRAASTQAGLDAIDVTAGYPPANA